MDSNETIRPLTDAPAQETPEALVATSTTMEESDVTITSLQTKEECLAFLEDICTIKEIQDISQRLEVAQMLSQGISYTTICNNISIIF